MNVVLKKSTTVDKMRELAAEALKARLFVPGWELSYELQTIKQAVDHGVYKKSLTLAYIDDVPVGICLWIKWKSRAPTLMTFVRKKHRRSGIGTKLIKKAIGDGKKFRYELGLKTAREFFEQFPNAVNCS